MRFGRTLVTGLLLRRALRELGGIREQLTRQNTLLERLALRLAPEPPAATAEDVVRLSGIDHINEREMGLVDEYVDRTRRHTGRDPTEEEILRYLADEQTIDLQQRLSEREEELHRVGTR